MKVKVDGLEVSLNKRDFIASGGEGAVYKKQKTAYKIYHDPKKMPEINKLKLLSQISSPNVISPEKIVYSGNNPVGYTMRYVDQGEPLCKIFTKAFKTRNNIQNNDILKLIEDFGSNVQSIHKENILIVDMNELNFLLNDTFEEIYFIDVDSYHTKDYPARVIMDSIRDRHMQQPTQGTDWFSWGILTFMMFIGVHPYKGKSGQHDDLDSRMSTNKSVFNTNVRIPRMCPPLSIIPEAYRKWYEHVFEKGGRLAPPLLTGAVALNISVPIQYQPNASFLYSDVCDYIEDLILFKFVKGKRVAQSKTSIYINDDRAHKIPFNGEVILNGDKIILARIENKKLRLFDPVFQKELQCDINAESGMTYGYSLYIKNRESIHELDFIGEKPFIKEVASVMENSTQMHNGVIFQEMLNTWYISIFPFKSTHYQLKVEELKGYRILGAKYRKNVLVVVGNKNGKYDKFILKIDSTFSKYTIRKKEDIQYQGIYFTSLDNGICFMVNEDDTAELFSSKYESSQVKVLQDVDLAGASICSSGNGIYTLQDKSLKQIKMK